MRTVPLTCDLQYDPATDGGWDTVGGDTEVGSAVPPGDGGETDHLANHFGRVPTMETSDVGLLLPPPLDGGLRVSLPVAPQHHVLPLPHRLVPAGPRDPGRLQHLEVGQLAPHGVGVDLAHVVTRVTSPNVRDLQPPLIVLRVRDSDPVVLSDDDLVEGEDRLSVDPDPGHLVVLADLDVAEEAGGPAHRHGGVGGGGEEVRLALQRRVSWRISPTSYNLLAVPFSPLMIWKRTMKTVVAAEIKYIERVLSVVRFYLNISFRRLRGSSILQSFLSAEDRNSY